MTESATAFITAQLPATSDGTAIRQDHEIATSQLTPFTVQSGTTYDLVVGLEGATPGFFARFIIQRNDMEISNQLRTVPLAGATVFSHTGLKNIHFEDRYFIRLAVGDFAKEWRFSVFDHVLEPPAEAPPTQPAPAPAPTEPAPTGPTAPTGEIRSVLDIPPAIGVAILNAFGPVGQSLMPLAPVIGWTIVGVTTVALAPTLLISGGRAIVGGVTKSISKAFEGD